MTPKKIFFFLGSFKLGGTEKVALQIGESLRSKGWDVWYVTIYDRKDYNRPVANHIVLLNGKPARFWLGAVEAWLNLRRAIRKERPRLIVAFSVGLNLFLFFQFFPRTVFVIDTNIFAFVKKWYYKHFLRVFIVFPHIRSVIIPSRGLRDACSAYFFTRGKLHVIGNPVDLERIDRLKEVPLDEQFLERGSYLISAGRIVTMKGFPAIVRAYAKSRCRSKYNLVIMGSGPAEEDTRQAIRELGLENRVFMIGFKDNPYRYFYRAKLFILNSQFESFGNVLIETLACDVPVLSSDCDFGPREIINSGNGMLFEFRNEDDLIGKMDLMLDDETRYNQMKSNCRKSVLQFDLVNISSQWEKAVEKHC